MTVEKTTDHEGLSLERQQRLEKLLSERLNPDGTRPQVDSYISSTLNYIRQQSEKMDNASDRHKAADEIANDLKQKFDTWYAQRRANEEK